MIDLRKIGAYISHLRKEKDMTQVELAERLNVSHQAVSKWERGESLPDVGTLLLLARLFTVSIDNILDAEEQTEIVQLENETIVEEAKVLLGQVSEHVDREEVGLDDAIIGERLEEPLDKGETLPQITKDADSSRLSIDHILELAPFLGREALDSLVQHVDADGLNLKFVQALAPFVSRDTLNELVERTTDGILEPHDFLEIVPFLGREHVDRLVLELADDKLDWDIVLSLAPFLRKQTMEELIVRIESMQLSADVLAQLAPFIHKETLNRLVLSLLAD